MSLINQMLKDLEERGAQNAGTEAEIASNLSTTDKISTQPLIASGAHFDMIKMGGLMLLLAGAAYLWTQNTLAQPRPAPPQLIANSQDNHIASAQTQAITPASVTPKITQEITETSDIKATNEVAQYAASPLFETELKFNVANLKTQDNPQTLPKPQALAKPQVLSKPQALPKNSNEDIALLAPASTQKNQLETAILPAPANIDNKAKSSPLEKPTYKANIDNTPISKQIRPDQKSANLYKQALLYLQQGRIAEAQAMLASALEASPSNHEARQTLAGLLLDNKRHDEAKSILAAGLAIAPEQVDFRMALARLQVEAGDVNAALNTLEKGASYASNHSIYQMFLATLLQRANRHTEAIAHYNAALSLDSTNANALVGLGISLQATDQLKESQEAYMQAQSNARLNPELLAFVEQRIKQIQQRLQN